MVVLFVCTVVALYGIVPSHHGTHILTTQYGDAHDSTFPTPGSVQVTTEGSALACKTSCDESSDCIGYATGVECWTYLLSTEGNLEHTMRTDAKWKRETSYGNATYHCPDLVLPLVELVSGTGDAVMTVLRNTSACDPAAVLVSYAGAAKSEFSRLRIETSASIKDTTVTYYTVSTIIVFIATISLLSAIHFGVSLHESK
jgi:cell division protein FtsL